MPFYILYILTKTRTNDMHVQRIKLFIVEGLVIFWCKLPEDGDYDGTRRSSQ